MRSVELLESALEHLSHAERPEERIALVICRRAQIFCHRNEARRAVEKAIEHLSCLDRGLPPRNYFRYRASESLRDALRLLS